MQVPCIIYPLLSLVNPHHRLPEPYRHLTTCRLNSPHTHTHTHSSNSNTRESSTQTEDKVQFQVKTEAGFKDLDKKLDLTMDGRATVGELKTFIEVGL